MASGNPELDPSKKSGEGAASGGEKTGRGKEIFEKYQDDDEKYVKFLTVLGATFPEKGPMDVLDNKLSDDEANKLNEALEAAFAEPAEESEEHPVAQPAGGNGEAAAAAAAATAAARTAYAERHGVVPHGAETISDEEKAKQAAKKAKGQKVLSTTVKVAAGAAAGVAGTLMILGAAGNGQDALMPANPDDGAKPGEAIVQLEDEEESIEEGETLGEYEDSLAGTYADAEDPTKINHNKLSRDGQHEAPFNFGESAIVYDENGEVDMEATYANAMEREDWLAHHSTIEFAGQYALLSDGVKVPEAVGLTGQQLAQRMMEDESFKQEVVESFMNLLHADGATSIEQITGTYANMYLIETAQEGEVITSGNTILKHCITEENGSYVLKLTYQDGKDGTTHTLLMRLGCGFQPVAEKGGDGWTGITETPRIPDPESPVTPPVNPETPPADPETPPADPETPPDDPGLKPKTDQPGIPGEWDKDDTDLTLTDEDIQDGQGVTFYEDDQGGGSFEAPAPVSDEAQNAEDQSDAGVLEADPSLDEVVAAQNQQEADNTSAQAREDFEQSVVATNPDTGADMTMEDVHEAVDSGAMTQEQANDAIAAEQAQQFEDAGITNDDGTLDMSQSEDFDF